MKEIPMSAPVPAATPAPGEPEPTLTLSQLRTALSSEAVWNWLSSMEDNRALPFLADVIMSQIPPVAAAHRHVFTGTIPGGPLTCACGAVMSNDGVTGTDPAAAAVRGPHPKESPDE